MDLGFIGKSIGTEMGKRETQKFMDILKK